MPNPAEKISELHDKLTSASDVENLMRLAIEEIILRYRTDVAILLVTPGSSEATCWAGTPATMPELLIPGLPAKIEANDLAGRVLKLGQVQIAQEPGLMMKECTVLVIPIKSEDAIVGLLRLSSDRLNAADAQLLSTFETIASYIADNIVRLRAPVALELPPQTEAAVPLPATMPTHVPPSSDARNLCERVYHGVAGLMVCDRFFVALGERIIYQVENGLELPSAPVSSEREMIAYIKRQRSGVLVADLEREVRFKILRGENSPSIKSLVCVPLAVNGNFLGVLSVQSGRAKSFSDVELKMLTVFADLMTMVLQNIQK